MLARPIPFRYIEFFIHLSESWLGKMPIDDTLTFSVSVTESCIYKLLRWEVLYSETRQACLFLDPQIKHIIFLCSEQFVLFYIIMLQTVHIALIVKPMNSTWRSLTVQSGDVEVNNMITIVRHYFVSLLGCALH